MLPFIVTRTQKLLARIGIGLCLVTLAYLLVFGPGPLRTHAVGETISYSTSIGMIAVCVAMSLLACMTGLTVWLSPKRVLKAAALLLFAAAALVLVSLPDIIRPGLIVTPDGFRMDTGAWYAPSETKITYESLASMRVVQTGIDGDGRAIRVLRCESKKDDGFVDVPVNDYVATALPHIHELAREKGVVVADE